MKSSDNNPIANKISPIVSPQGKLTSVPLPDVDIPPEIVFRNLFKQQSTKQDLNAQLSGTSALSPTNKEKGPAQPAYGNEVYSSTTSASRRQLLSKLTISQSSGQANSRRRLATGESSASNSNQNHNADGSNNQARLLGSIVVPEQTDQILIPIRNHKERPRVIKLIQAMHKHFEQSRKTRHLSIAYADYLLSFDDIFDTYFRDQKYFQQKSSIFDVGTRRTTLSRLRMEPHMLAVVSVLMASKFFEVDDNLIAIQDIQQFLKGSSKIDRHYRITYDDVTRSELFALERLQWDLHRILPLDFAEIYHDLLRRHMNQASFSSHEHRLEKIWTEVEKSFDSFMSCHDRFLQYRQSDVAFALVKLSLSKTVENDESLCRLVQTDRYYQKIFNLIATSDEIKIYSHEAQKRSADLSKSLDDITSKLMSHVFLEGESARSPSLAKSKRPQTLTASLRKTHQTPSSGSFYGVRHGEALRMERGTPEDQEDMLDIVEVGTQRSSVEQQSFIDEDESEPKFKGLHCESKSIVTLTEAVNSFKKSIAAAQPQEHESLPKKVGKGSAASRQETKAAAGTVPGENSTRLRNSIKNVSLSQTTQVQAGTTHFAQLTKQVRQHWNINNQRNQSKAAPNQYTEVRDLSPLVCSKDDSPTLEHKKIVATKYVELDENFREVQQVAGCGSSSPIEIEEEEEGFELKPEWKVGFAKARPSQDQSSMIESSIYLQGESQQSFDAGPQKSHHYLSKRLQSKLDELNIRKIEPSNEAPGSHIEEAKEQKDLPSTLPILRSETMVKERPEKAVDSFKDLQPVITPDPDLEKLGQAAAKAGPRVSTAKTSPTKQNYFESTNLYQPDTSKFYTFSKEQKPTVDISGKEVRANQVIKLSGRKKSNMQEQSRTKDCMLTRNNEFEAVLTERITIREVKESSKDGISNRYVMQKQKSPPTYFATINSTDNGYLHAIRSKNQSLLTQVHAKNPNQGMGPKMANAKTTAQLKNQRKPLLNTLCNDQYSFPHKNQVMVNSFSNKKISLINSSHRLRSGEPKVNGNHKSQKIDCDTDSHFNKQLLVTQSQKYDRGVNKETTSTAANFKTRCSSSRLDTKILNSHSKGKLLRNLNSQVGSNKRANSNVPASNKSKMSASKMSANGSEWHNKQIQHAAAAVMVRSKQQSAKNLKQQPKYRANGMNCQAQGLNPGKLSTDGDDRLETAVTCKREMSIHQTQRKAQHNQLLFKQTDRVYQRLAADESRNDSEYSRSYLRSNPSYQKMGSLEMMHSQESLKRYRAGCGDKRKTKAMGTVLGIRNQNQTERFGQNLYAINHDESQQMIGKLNSKQTTLDQYQHGQKKQLTGNRSTKQITTLHATKQLGKCKSNYFEKAAPNKSTQVLQDGRQNVSPQLLQNISHAFSQDKISTLEQILKSTDPKMGGKKGKKSPEANIKNRTHYQMLFDPDEKSPPASNKHDKRGSISVFKPTDSRIRSKGSFSLCMSSANHKLRVREDDQLKCQQRTTDQTRNAKRISHSRQRKQSVSQQQIKGANDETKILPGVPCAKYSHTAAELNREAHRKKKNNKKDHYLKILRAHNEQQSQKQSGVGAKSPQTNTHVSTSSTTPAGGHASVKPGAIRSLRPGAQVLKQGEFTLGNVNSRGGLTFFKSPRAAAPLESTNECNDNEDDGTDQQKSGKNDRYNAHWSDKKSSDIDQEKYRTQHTSKVSAKPPGKDLQTDREGPADSKQDCNKYYTIAESGSGRSRMKDASGKRAAVMTAGSLSNQHELTSKEASPLWAKSGGAHEKHKSIRVNMATAPEKSGNLIDAAERPSIITPKQNPLTRAQRIASTDSQNIGSGQNSTKNLHPRAFRNKYQSSSKKDDLVKQRHDLGASTHKEESPQESGKTKKMVVFSPSLKQGPKVFKYTNPFQTSNSRTQHSGTKRGTHGGASSSMGHAKKSSSRAENGLPTKMMSFVERRQIYLNSTGYGLDKPEQKKHGADSESAASVDREGKTSALKFNQTTTDKTEFGIDSTRVEAITTPRSLIPAQDAKSEQKTGDTWRSASKAKPHLHGTEYLSKTLHSSKNATRTLWKSKNDMASILQLQLEQQAGMECGPATDRLDFLTSKKKAEPRETLDEQAAPSYSANDQHPNSSRAQRSQRLHKSHLSKKSQVGPVPQLPMQIHAPGAASVLPTASKVCQAAQSLLELSRLKSNYSELKVKTSLIEINLDNLKSNMMDSAEMSKLDESQKSARTIHPKSSFTRSPLQSRHSFIPSTSDSITRRPLTKKDKAKVGSQPSVILEASDQCENEAVPTTMTCDNDNENEGTASVAVASLASQEYPPKHHKNTMVLHQPSGSAITGPLEASGAWQSHSCVQQPATDLYASQKKCSQQPSGKQQPLNQHSYNNKQKTAMNMKKQRRTAQERKTSKRVPLDN